MKTFQSAVAQIRALEFEEIELVGGGACMYSEATQGYTMQVVTYVGPDGHSYTVTVPGDVYPDQSMVID